MGFEPTRAEPIGLAVQRLNHSATSSGWLSRRFGMVWGSSQPLSWEKMRRPGIEPGSTAWKAAMLTIIPPTLVHVTNNNNSSTIGIITEEMSQTATRVLCVHCAHVLY